MKLLTFRFRQKNYLDDVISYQGYLKLKQLLKKKWIQSGTSSSGHWQRLESRSANLYNSRSVMYLEDL